MIILLLVIYIAMLIVGARLFQDFDWELVGGVLAAIGGGVGFILLIVAFVLTLQVIDASVIDERIQMYTEENAKIEEQIATVVSQYQEYEYDIFTEVAPDSAVVLASLYPDLKSDTLVQSQIAVYIANNEKIKALKNDAIYAPVYRWWLYFGK